MYLCSAAEIVEKKRIALEKLSANTPNLVTANNNKQRIAHQPKVAPNIVTAAPSTSTFPRVESKAFLNAPKGSTTIKQRQETQHLIRNAMHPYRRPASVGDVRSFNNYKSFKPTNDRPSGRLLGLGQPQKPMVSCEVTLLSVTRFEVQPSGYHSKLVEVFRTIPSKSYEPATRYWNFALSDYKALQDRVNNLKPDVKMGIIPQAVLNLCLAPPKQLDNSCLESLEPTLRSKLMPFQRIGVSFALSQNGRCMICDEMGLGKTYQAIAVADFYKKDWPLFICTTATTRDSWTNHIRQLLPYVPFDSIQVLTSNQKRIEGCTVLITSYSMMERNLQQIMNRKFGFLIFDESHNLKNPKAKCTKAADRLSQQAKRVLLLSGTPALSKPVELFSQLQMVDRKFMRFIDFTTRYCDGKQTNFGWDANGQSNLKELNVVLKLKFMIRRTKAEVLRDLSEKFRETVVLDPALVWTSDEIKASLDAVTKTLLRSKGHEREQTLLLFYAQTAQIKTRAVCAYLKQQVKDPKKFIVFAHHRVMMDAICECLDNLEVQYIRIDGNTREHDRGKFIDTFQTKQSCKVAVLSLGACNSGITLTAAELIIFAELTWNPSTLAQAESRAHRIGQQNPVTCRYLMASKTADDHIWKILKTKQDVLNKAGIFCEDLQDAAHTSAPTTSKKVDKNYTPIKTSNPDLAQQSSSATIHNKSDPPSSIPGSDTSKKIENIEDFFQDDDDEVFKDIFC